MIFFLWPAVLGLSYSFTDYRGVGSPDFIGFANYAELFADPDFYRALGRTFLFVAMSVPVGFVLSLTLAVLLVNPHTKGKPVARLVFFLPWLISPIVAGVTWRWLFGESFGIVNYAISQLGGNPLQWSTNGTLALIVIVLAAAWGGAAFNMLLFMAAIRNVPASYYEAAALDGANGWQRFRHITLPSIAPTSFMVILLSTIGSMKEFALIQALSGGGPGTENRLIVQYIYETGFEFARVGYASAVSMVLMVILIVMAVIQLGIDRRASRDLA